MVPRTAWQYARWPAGFAVGMLLDELLFAVVAQGTRGHPDLGTFASSLLTFVGGGAAAYITRGRGWAVGMAYALIKQTALVTFLVAMRLGVPYPSVSTPGSAVSLPGAVAEVLHVGGAGFVVAALAAVPAGMLGGYLAERLVEKRSGPGHHSV